MPLTTAPEQLNSLFINSSDYLDLSVHYDIKSRILMLEAVCDSSIVLLLIKWYTKQQAEEDTN